MNRSISGTQQHCLADIEERCAEAACAPNGPPKVSLSNTGAPRARLPGQARGGCAIADEVHRSSAARIHELLLTIAAFCAGRAIANSAKFAKRRRRAK